MKLKIVSDGTYHGTKITNEHGELIENISALSIFWETKPGDVARASIDVTMSTCDIEIVGDPKVVCQENKLRIVPSMVPRPQRTGSRHFVCPTCKSVQTDIDAREPTPRCLECGTDLFIVEA